MYKELRKKSSKSTHRAELDFPCKCGLPGLRQKRLVVRVTRPQHESEHESRCQQGAHHRNNRHSLPETVSLLRSRKLCMQT